MLKRDISFHEMQLIRVKMHDMKMLENISHKPLSMQSNHDLYFLSFVNILHSLKNCIMHEYGIHLCKDNCRYFLTCILLMNFGYES